MSQLRLAGEEAPGRGNPPVTSLRVWARAQVGKKREGSTWFGWPGHLLLGPSVFFSRFFGLFCFFGVVSLIGRLVIGRLELMSNARRRGSRSRGVLVARLGGVNNPPIISKILRCSKRSVPFWVFPPRHLPRGVHGRFPVINDALLLRFGCCRFFLLPS